MEGYAENRQSYEENKKPADFVSRRVSMDLIFRFRDERRRNR